jgi:dienelactone hydrolase
VLAVVLSTMAVAVAGSEARPARQAGPVTLVVSPSDALLDRAVDVRVSGLRPGQMIELQAATHDALGQAWRSRLVFRASRNGVVDTHRRMRLFWGMEPAKKPVTPQPFIPSVGPTQVAIRAVAARRTLATGVLVRRGTKANVSRTDATLAAQGFVGAYFAPPPGTPGPAVLQVGGALGSYGYFPAALLAGHGYPTLSLAYFNEPGLPKTLKDVPLEYFANALRWLAAQPGVDPNRILIYGVSRGAEAALLIGTTYPQLVHGVLASSPGADVIGAYPGPGSAWTLGGKPVPDGPIPVWQISGPVLAFGGGRDLYWPSDYAVHEILERSHEHGRPDITGRIYADAGHGVGFGIPNLPTYGRVIKLGNHYIGIGGLPGANVRAWAASWPLVLRFIRTMPA